MRSSFNILLFAAISVFISSKAEAAATASLFDVVAPTNSVSIAPGTSFSLSLNITTTTETTVGLTYYLVTGTNGSGFFSIIGRDITGSTYNDRTFSDVEVTSSGEVRTPAGSDNVLNVKNDYDLGATKNSGTNAPGTYFVSNLTLATSNAIPLGTYTLTLSSDSIVTNSSFSDITLSANTYTVNIVPEPSSWLMVAGGFVLGMLIFKRRLFCLRAD